MSQGLLIKLLAVEGFFCYNIDTFSFLFLFPTFLLVQVAV